MSSKAGKPKVKTSTAPPPAPVTVKQCLVWPEATPAKKSTKNTGGVKPKPNKKVVSAQPNGKQEAANQNERKPCCQLGGHFELPKEKEEEKLIDPGTVSEAMRGWPNKKVQEPEIDMDAYFAANNENMDLNSADNGTDLRDLSRSKKTTFLPKKKDKKEAAEKEPAASMGDIMAYRYHREYEEQLKAQSDKEAKKKSKQSGEEKEIRERSKLTNNIKANRSGQLRSISLADKVDQSALDLWKMSRFKDAKSKISSKRCEEDPTASADEARYIKPSNQIVDDNYPYGLDMPDNAASPPTGFYQDDGLDSPLSYYSDE